MRAHWKNFCSGMRGTLVLESGILLPAYLIMLLFLVSMIKLSVVFAFSNELAHNAVAYSARAAHAVDRAYYFLAEEMSDVEAMRQFFLAAEAANRDNSFGELLRDIGSGTQNLTNEFGRRALVDVRLKEYEDHVLFRKDSIEVTKADFDDKMVEVVVNYKTTIPVPFARQDFTFTARGYERQWIGKRYDQPVH